MLTTVLLVAMTFLLTMSLMTVTQHEVVISGAHRDSVLALELAEAGVQEAIRRMESGISYAPDFAGSLTVSGSQVHVDVVRRYTGVNTAYQEIRVDAQVGRATRRLTAVVLHRSRAFPPNVISSESLIQEHDADVICGDLYARTFVRYARLPLNSCVEPPALTYAGWRISTGGATPIPPCYSHAGCIAATTESGDGTRWYPAHRRAEIAQLGDEIAGQRKQCPAGDGGALPPDTITGVRASDQCDPSCTTETIGVYGFDADDPDGIGGVPPQAIIPGVLPCGLPHKWREIVFSDEHGNTVRRLVKSVSFDQWFSVYWRFEEGRLTYVKRDGSPCSDTRCLSSGREPDLMRYPEFGAVLPFPEIERTVENFDCRMLGGGTIRVASVCESSADRPALVVLDEGDYRLDGVTTGHGTVVVNGSLSVGGQVGFWGTMVVNGSLIFDSGSPVIHGGVIAKGILRLGGQTKINGGGMTSSIPIGTSTASVRAWWER